VGVIQDRRGERQWTSVADGEAIAAAGDRGPRADDELAPGASGEVQRPAMCGCGAEAEPGKVMGRAQ
ncbi:MAG: hypothetical protein D6688_05615, partial [Alphaproteobacteria bacterium]